MRKLTLLASMASLRIIQMMLAYENDSEQPINEVFTPQEQQCLKQLNRKVEGQTKLLKNPCLPKTLRWATWIIARLGGWKAYTSQRKPGPIVLQKGLIKFYILYEGWSMAIELQKDVGTQ